MPYFRYKAINLDGSIACSSIQALSASDLRELLYKQDRGLMSATITLPRSWAKPSRSSQGIDFFVQLAALLNAGVFLSDALDLIAQQSNSPVLKAIINDIAYQVKAGVPFVVALKQYKTFCNPLYLHLLNAGEQTGSLALALQHCATFDHIIRQFYKNIKQAMLVPAITLSVFGVITLLIVMCIIPTFASMLATIQQELPPATKALIGFSSFIRSRQFLLWCLGVGGLVYVISRLINRYGKHYKDMLKIRLPIIGTFYKASQNAYCFQALALLLDGGITQADAVTMITLSIENDHIKTKWKSISQKLKQGISFDQALSESELISKQMVAMIAIGQSSNCLSFMCQQVGKHYTEFVSKRLQRLVSLVQPLIMILLGLLLTGLIVAVYMPIVQLSMALH